MRTVSAYAAPSAEAPLEPITIQRRDLGERDVLIEIAFAGICHSDIHAARGSGVPWTTRWCPGTRSPARWCRSAPR